MSGICLRIYREYCQEAFDNNIIFFRPTDPKLIDKEWFSRTKNLYDKKETGQIGPISFHFWAVDGEEFIGEFQLRTELTQEVMNGIGSIGYAVRVSEQGKLMDRIQSYNDAEGHHIMRRYWIYLQNEGIVLKTHNRRKDCGKGIRRPVMSNINDTSVEKQ